MSERIIEIKPLKGWSLPEWRKMIQYRDLFVQLARREIVVKYKQTVLGPLWVVIQPLALTVILTLVVGRMVDARQDHNGYLFFYAALIPWNYFSQTVQSVGGLFISNLHLFSKVYFPRLVVPVAMAGANLIGLAINGLLLILTALLVAQDAVSPRLALLPVAFAWAAVVVLAIGLLIACTTARYRDLSIATPFLLQILFFASPILYPLEKLDPALREVIAVCNPMTLVIETTRFAITGRISMSGLEIAAAAALTALLLLGALVVFQRVERTVIDTV
ncbi:lipopolysaccharide transport system permease protein [Skermanella aerolata]|uniref:ABC transporter permease n=1 Tax=Skermanella aerolata TaxID=393310 RepID=UPI003D23F488